MQRVRLSSRHAPVQKLAPKIQLAAVSDDLLGSEPLLPGLPDDIALSCLLRLPVEFHSAGRTVCRRWYHLFEDKARFFTLRKEMGFQEPWLFALSFHKRTRKIEWHVLDLIHLSWHTIPSTPCMEKLCPHGFRCVSVPDGSLFVCGGMSSDVDCPLNSVSKFQVRSNRWTPVEKMITPRSFFASGEIEGMVYVAGGNSGNGAELNSAEVMDPKDGIWRPIANMRANMSVYDAAVVQGKLLVTEGWFWPFCVVPRGEIYDPKKDRWECMARGLREGWTGCSVVMQGRLFVVSEHERTKVKVYEWSEDRWESVRGGPLPEQICKPFVVKGCNNKIYVIGRNFHVAIGVIHDHAHGHGHGHNTFLVEWQVVKAPDSFLDLTPSNAQILFA